MDTGQVACWGKGKRPLLGWVEAVFLAKLTAFVFFFIGGLSSGRAGFALRVD